MSISNPRIPAGRHAKAGKPKDDLPVYDAADHGLTDDLIQTPPSSQHRNASAARYQGHRRTLLEELNKASEQTNGQSTAVAAGGTNDTLSARTARRELRAVIYVRVSTEEQAKVGGTKEGYSIPAQREACIRKAEQLGAVVANVYVEAGLSAKTTHRPRLQEMLSDLPTLDIDYVIVHKVDRLARNRKDDAVITEQILAAGARLISVSEAIDDTPSGRLQHGIMATFAQFYIDNLKAEVLKGTTTKAQAGGTPYRAPLGYLNKRDIIQGADVRWIEVDPERAPLVTWAFDEYATGQWTLLRLQEALAEKGFTTRPTPKRAAKPISLNGMYLMLRNPYYIGIVPYRGVYHEGTHDPLVSIDTWLRVQDVLSAHNSAGEKDRKHPHYLKGTIYCGGCGGRLIYSRNTGRGGTYEYFFCLSKKLKRAPCVRGAVQVHRIETGVEAFYQTFQLPEAKIRLIRRAIQAELAKEREQASQDAARATARIRILKDERKSLLQAHYRGAVPPDLLDEEMQRFTRDIAAAEQAVVTASKTLTELDEALDQALTVAGNCAQNYLAAPPRIRRQMNQGFFKRLLISTDGTVEQADFTEPFVAILRRERTSTATKAQGSAQEVSPGEPDAPPADQGHEHAADAPDTSTDKLGVAGQPTWLAALATNLDDLEANVDDLVHGGVKEAGLAEAEGFEPPDGINRLALSSSTRSRPRPFSGAGTACWQHANTLARPPTDCHE